MFTQKLGNGLEVLVIEDNSVPLATVEITCKNGSFTETPKFNGLSHLYEHMFFKANKDYENQDEFLQRTSELGISFNGETSFENVHYYFTLPKNNLKSGMKLMNSAIRYPSFDPVEMQKENVVVDREFQRDESQPFFALNDTIEHHLWGDLYSRKHVIGDHLVIRNATPALMDSIKNKYYYPNNALLTIAGDVKHEDVFKMVENIFGDWKASSFDPFTRWPVPEFKALQKSDYEVVQSANTKVPYFKFTWIGPDTRHDLPATYTADVFSYILEQNSSKFKQALIESGLALNVSFGYLTLGHAGPITLSVVPNPQKIKECYAEVKRQLSLFDNDSYITDAQLATAKLKLGIAQLEEQEVTTSFVHTLAFWWASASLDYFYTYTDNVDKVTKADIKTYVDKYIKDKPFVAGLSINPAMKASLQPDTFFKE